MITTRDIKVFIFSILITTLCLGLFNNNPIKEAEAQVGDLTHEEGARIIHGNIFDLISDHNDASRRGHEVSIEKLDRLLDADRRHGARK